MPERRTVRDGLSTWTLPTLDRESDRYRVHLEMALANNLMSHAEGYAAKLDTLQILRQQIVNSK